MELKELVGCTTSEIPNVFKGIGKQQAFVLVKEMYAHAEFSDGVIRVTNRTTVVLIDRFIDFLRWKELNHENAFTNVS